MTRGGSGPDPEFLEFVGARQHGLLRAAFLVSGDPELAEQSLDEALTSLAGQWDRAREERPDAVVRGTLYGAVLRALRRPGPGPAGPSVAVEPEDLLDLDAQEDRRRSREVLAALGALTPQQRAVTVLRVYEERSAHDTAEILGVRSGAVQETPGAEPAGDEVLFTREALELASEDVIEVDLAAAAWDRAALARRRVRRRSVLGVAGVAVAGAAVAAVAAVRRDGTRTALRVTPSPTTSPTLGADGTLPSIGVNGIRVALAPEARLEPNLPAYPDADSLALPAVLGPSQGVIHPVLGTGAIAGVAEPVRAVFLVHALGGGYDPVVFVPGGAVTHLVVPSVRLGGSGAGSGDSVPVLGPRTIAEDRHHLVFVQPRALVVLDTRDASTTWVDVPDPSLMSAGWARDGVTVIARGATESWVVDTATTQVRRAEGPVGTEWVDLVDLGTRSLLRSFSGSGVLTDTREMRGPGISPTSAPVANTEGWVAVGAAIPADISRAMSRDHGIVVVQGDLRPSPRILAAAQGPKSGGRPYRAVAWGPQDVSLLESLSVDEPTGRAVRRLLAWDVIGGTLSLVSVLEPESAEVSGFTGSWAI